MELRGKQKTSEQQGAEANRSRQRAARLCPRCLGHPEACLPSSTPTRTCGQPAPHHYSRYKQSRATPTYLRVQVADQKDGIPCACQAWNGDAASGSSCSSRRYG
ncbi:hypothetical protein U0070_020126 [Myodes glareolus]|uniref:Uncharacterized protein n=1 Tax=Myodes glareolus TaxID=447135 RepID=A0AAW0HPE1_MYOGA